MSATAQKIDYDKLKTKVTEELESPVLRGGPHVAAIAAINTAIKTHLTRLEQLWEILRTAVKNKEEFNNLESLVAKLVESKKALQNQKESNGN